MNVSMIATLVAGDAGGNAAAAGNGGTGEGFGLAVKDAAEQHGRQTKSAKGASRREDQAGDKDGKIADDGEAVAEGDAEGADGPVATADILSRLLGASVLSSYGQSVVEPGAEQAGGGAAGDEQPSADLEERIVISTVADLAGTSGDEQPKRVALSVRSMETHFEPHRNAPTLVDAEPPASATAIDPALVAGGAEGGAEPIKQPFAEILQRLDAGRLDKAGSGDDAGAGGDDRANGERSGKRASSPRDAAHRQADGRSQAEGIGSRAPAGGADLRASANGGGNASTGQIINAQLAEHIIGAFADQPSAVAEPSAPAQSANVQVLRLTAGGGALKTLSIQLEPQDLGRVDVSMRLIDGRLTVELAASEPSTAATLAGDRQGLRKILEHAGFALDDAAISIVARDAGAVPSSPSSSTSGGDASAGRQSSQGQSFGDPGGNRRGNERQPFAERRQASLEARTDVLSPVSAQRNGSVYL